MKNILVTGGAGFIGSAFVRRMTQTYPDFHIIAYDKMTYAGNMDNLLPVSKAANFSFVQGDIADREAVMSAYQTYNVDTVVNFAAESHVDRSILSPDAFINSNTVGVHILLESAQKHGIERFLHVSTDEVYGDIEGDHFSLEDDPFKPNSPYSASKAGGDLMVRAYHVTYGMNTVVTRGSNTFGPYQYPEKLMPFFISEAIDDRPLPLVRVIDMKLESRKQGGGLAILSSKLREAIEARLTEGEQSILFLNRRGFARSMLCPECGYVAECPHCSLALTFHREDDRLLCHGRTGAGRYR